MNKMSLTPVPVTSSPSRNTTNFDEELSNFLVELSRTEDMSSLEDSLLRLKLAWMEQQKAYSNQEDEEGKMSHSLFNPFHCN